MDTEHDTRPPDRDLAAEIEGLRAVISSMLDDRDSHRRATDERIMKLETSLASAKII